MAPRCVAGPKGQIGASGESRESVASCCVFGPRNRSDASGEGCESGEAVFAPCIGGSEEDDGYVICFVYDPVSETSECQIIDARNFEAQPVARIKIPQRVPHGFHASWVNV